MSSLEEDGLGRAAHPTQWGAALIGALRAAGPPLLFGLRMWASVCLALYVANIPPELQSAPQQGGGISIWPKSFVGQERRIGAVRNISALPPRADVGADIVEPPLSARSGHRSFIPQ
jgi:hypothetical protein